MEMTMQQIEQISYVLRWIQEQYCIHLTNFLDFPQPTKLNNIPKSLNLLVEKLSIHPRYKNVCAHNQGNYGYPQF